MLAAAEGRAFYLGPASRQTTCTPRDQWQQAHSQQGLCLSLPHSRCKHHAKMLRSALQPQLGPLRTVASSLDPPEEDANHSVAAAVGHLPTCCEGPDQNSSGNVSLGLDPTLKTLLVASSLWSTALPLRDPSLPDPCPPQILADFGFYLPLPSGFVWLMSGFDEGTGIQQGS